MATRLTWTAFWKTFWRQKTDSGMKINCFIWMSSKKKPLKKKRYFILLMCGSCLSWLIKWGSRSRSRWLTLEYKVECRHWQYCRTDLMQFPKRGNNRGGPLTCAVPDHTSVCLVKISNEFPAWSYCIHNVLHVSNEDGSRPRNWHEMTRSVCLELFYRSKYYFY